MKRYLFGLVFLLLTPQLPAAPTFKDVMPDTWAATDALGRALPGYAECGPVKKDRTVATFYFLWQGQHGVGGPYDITQILAANPKNPKWGPEGAFHFWGQPEHGYYISNDEWVMRKNARMLVNAGVDVIVLDVTNSFVYHDVTMQLCRTYMQLRREGLPTPQICFMLNSEPPATAAKLYDEFYSKNYFPDLWFRWQGKPLLLSGPEGMADKVKSFFTFRRSWAWSKGQEWFGDGKDKWPWLDNTPQGYGWHVSPEVPEMICACVAQHPISNIGRSFHDGKQPGASELQTASGPYFSEQWKRALEVAPPFLFVTGWNEWVAQRGVSDGKGMAIGEHLLKAGESFFVDAYTQEYSRDIEPMRGGHTDNYYYQMISGIRRYKGVQKPPVASPGKTIKIDGNFADWTGVQPDYRDYARDVERRNSIGWGSVGRLVNTTGRNDFVALKVARDKSNVYFYAKTADAITAKATSAAWMQLLINTDNDPTTGWRGYDVLIGDLSPQPGNTTYARKNSGGWNWLEGMPVKLVYKDNEMELSVPRKALGVFAKPLGFEFHWMDNIANPADDQSFLTEGDSAPDRRFNYVYQTASP